MLRLSSLGPKIVSAMLAVACIGIALLVGTTLLQLSWTQKREIAVLEEISTEKTLVRLNGEARLATDRLDWMLNGLDDQIKSIARLPDSAKAIESRNDVALAKGIGDQLRAIGFDGGIIIDEKMRVIGADRAGANLLGAASALGKVGWRTQVEKLIATNDPAKRVAWHTLAEIDPDTRNALLIEARETLGFLAAHPVFDDFGDVKGIILAYRMVRKREPALDDFTAQTGGAILMASRTGVSTFSGKKTEPSDWDQPTDGKVHLTSARQAVLCAPYRAVARICALRDLDEINRERDQLLKMGQSHAYELRIGMLVVAALALLLVGISSWGLARGLARPLGDVTRSVREVAVGQLDTPLLHRDRTDEIGAIANALFVMREALREREALHDGAKRAALAKLRQQKIEQAIAMFEASMRGVMSTVKTTITDLGATSQDLDEASRVAHQDALSAVDATETTSASTRYINVATAELSQSISGVTQRLRDTSEVMVECDTLAHSANDSVVLLDDAANQIVDVVRLISDVARHTNLLALNATIEAARAGEAGRGFSVVASEVKELAHQTAVATSTIAARIDGMRKATSDVVKATQKIAEMLSRAMAIVSEISGAMDVQERTSHEIAQSMSEASQAMEMVQSSVGSLKGTIDQSVKASSIFIEATYSIVQGSDVIDATIKTFLEEVADQEAA